MIFGDVILRRLTFQLLRLPCPAQLPVSTAVRRLSALQLMVHSICLAAFTLIHQRKEGRSHHKASYGKLNTWLLSQQIVLQALYHARTEIPFPFQEMPAFKWRLASSNFTYFNFYKRVLPAPRGKMRYSI